MINRWTWHRAMIRENAHCSIIEEDTPRAIQLGGDAEIVEQEAAFLRPRFLPRREATLGVGFSLGIHVATALTVLLLPFFSAPYGVKEHSFITVSLVSLAGSGNGMGAVQNGAGEAGSFAGLIEPGPSNTAGTAGEHPPVDVAPLKSYSVANPKVVRADVRNETIEIQHPPGPASLKTPPPVRLKPVEGKDKRVACALIGTKPESHSKMVSGPPADSTIASVPSSHDQLFPQGGGTAGESDGRNGSGGEGTSGRGTGSNSSGGGVSSAGAGSLSGEFGLKQVDQPPSPVRKIEPEFPLTARQLGTGGRVVLKFLVKADGNVARAAVVEADPKGIFEQSALDAIVQWQFKPGRFRGNAVATWVVLPIKFRLYR